MKHQHLHRTLRSISLLASLAALGSAAHAQQNAAPPAAAASAAWKYKTTHVHRADIDALLAHPDKVLLLDLRRPDEQIQYGSFPAFLSIQFTELEKSLDYIPRDRQILTVSNHAQRAGAAGDLLASKGYRVAGAAGSEEYENEGGKQVAHIRPPAPRPASAPQ
ncbi:MAG: rhodanese-like domain-containing protein [Burkholderiaceae bacterium]|nr:rhodanese-like domain-containing protein [Burkholderiaceae bacterium]